jgi:hypothetical protein
MPSLQCLFCQHLNPTGVDYCNSCDGQLNLQPCYRCGGVDLRTASKCHGCGGEFSPPAVPVPDFQFTPSNFDSIDETPTSPEMPQSETAHLNADPAYSHLDRPSVGEAISLENPHPAAQSQRGTRFAVLGLLLLLLVAALSAYVYRRHPAPVDRPQGQEQAANDLPASRNPRESAASNQASELDAASTPIKTVQSPPSSANQAAQPHATASPGADAALSLHPVPATAANADTSQDPPTVKTCPPAVAALGLCNLDTPQEKP